MTVSPLAEFAAIRSWIFDLDNTLYPPTTALFSQIDAKMSGFISEWLDVTPARAKELQKHYYHTYGTTLRGLMTEHGMDPHRFLDCVHDIDHSVIAPDALLAEALAALPGRKFIFTNGSRRHAENVSDRLGISHVFEDMFDIVAADFVPKPDAKPYERFLAVTNVEPDTAVMFEDLARNLAVPHALGMRTVLITGSKDRSARADWENAGEDAAHVDHRTDDLAAFLSDILMALEQE
ncbi:Pyridoxal-5'-phosphate phosphatase, Alphaproteobacterial type [hydrothermal vent metagenome]|uniref:Pyridoxal-5'-phosphate phosphatase, Alphaproteobacterial type n=1 Tax=hydrothermal vent metagenome TaxID=652676 RepID=A0A3B0TJD0_9ZZZZ